MIRPFYTFLLLFLVFQTSYAQTTVDSLTVAFQQASDHERIDLAYQLARIFTSSDSAKAAAYIEKGLSLANSIEDSSGMIQGQLVLAYFNTNYNLPHLAIEHILQLLHKFKNISFRDSISVNDVLANSFLQLDAIEMALDYRKRQLHLLNRTPLLRDRYYVVENVAYLFGRLHQKDSAEAYYEKAYQLANQLDDPSLLMHCNNNLGYFYNEQDDHEQSLIYYNRAIGFFEDMLSRNDRDSLLYAIITGNIGVVYKKQGKLEEAGERLSLSREILWNVNARGNQDSLHYGTYSIHLADVLLEQEKFDQAEAILASVYNNLQGSPDLLSRYYGVLSEVFEATNRNEASIQALRMQQELNEDRIRKRRTMNNTVHGLVAFQEDRIVREIQLMSLLVERGKQLNSLKIIFLSGLSLAVLMIMFILFYKYRSVQQKKTALLEMERNVQKLQLRNQELERDRLKEELQYKNKDLVDFAINMTRNQDSIKEISNRLQGLDTSLKVRKELQDIIIYTKSQLVIDESMKIFQENVDKVNHEFMAVLQERYPDLSVNEQRICALLRLQLSTKEIATIKNISPDSVKVMRHRLRKKLGLPPDTNLNAFFDSLI